MKIYTQIGDDGTVTAFSTCSTADVQVEAQVTGPLYPEKFPATNWNRTTPVSIILSLMRSSTRHTSSRNRKRRPLPKQKTDWPKSAGMPCWPVWMMRWR